MSSSTDTQPPDRHPPVGGKGLPLVALIVLVALAMSVLWVGGSRGYLPPIWEGGWGCSDVGYPDPPPSFDDLVSEYDESPYCARRVLGEEWF